MSQTLQKNQSSSEANQDLFSRAADTHWFLPEIKISLFIHIAIYLVFTVKTVFFPDTEDLIMNAVQVDMVALPDKQATLDSLPSKKEEPKVEAKKEEPKKLDPPPKEEKPKQTEKVADSKVPSEKTKPEKIPTKKDSEAIKLEKDKSTQKQALEKLKQMDALEKLEKQVEKENKQKAIDEVKKNVVKGNVLASGSDLKGLNQIQAESYRGEVQRHMKKNWEIPHYIKKTNLITEVLVKFDSNGVIISKTIVKSSGNSSYDDAVLEAIDRSSPVPPPPSKFSTIASAEGFTFVFKPEQ